QKFADAREWFQEALKLDAGNFAAHYFFAASAIRSGKLDKALQDSVEESLRAAIKLNPSFAFAYDVLAMFYSNRGIRPAEVHDLIEKAVQLAPGVPEIRVNEAQILVNMNKNKEAIDVLETALAMTHTPEQTAAVENVLQTFRKFEVERTKLGSQKVAFQPLSGPPDAKG